MGALLVFSQVLLSLQLGFAIIPLIHFVSDKKTMGSFAISFPTKFFSWAVTILLVYLNMRMVFTDAIGYMSGTGNIIIDGLILAGCAGFILLLLITIVYPLRRRYREDAAAGIHAAQVSLGEMEKPSYRRIAMALDFSERDKDIFSNAIAHGNEYTQYILIHIVESASAKYFGKDSDDLETRRDQEQLDKYVQFFAGRNYKATGVLGYKKRSSEIARIIKEQGCDLLIIGSHGHKAIGDWLFGETINTVRHMIHIPVFIAK